MSWPLSGNWDRATTPPGASTEDRGAILEALCRAYNERRDYCHGGLIPHQSFVYTSAGAFSDFPTAAQFAGALNGGDGGQGLVKEFFFQAEFSHPTDDASVFTWYKEAACINAYLAGEIRTLASAGLSAFDINREGLDATNFLIYKRMFDLCVYCFYLGAATDLRPLLTDQIP